MKKERDFYQKPRSFALFWGISAVFPAGRAVGRVGMLDDVARQGEQGDGVGDDHELVEHVAQLPDEVVGHRGAEEDENQREQRVDVGALFAEEVDMLILPNRFQLRIVENAKKNRHTATNILPAL